MTSANPVLLLLLKRAVYQANWCHPDTLRCWKQPQGASYPPGGPGWWGPGCGLAGPRQAAAGGAMGKSVAADLMYSTSLKASVPVHTPGCCNMRSYLLPMECWQRLWACVVQHACAPLAADLPWATGHCLSNKLQCQTCTWLYRYNQATCLVSVRVSELSPLPYAWPCRVPQRAAHSLAWCVMLLASGLGAGLIQEGLIIASWSREHVPAEQH